MQLVIIARTVNINFSYTNLTIFILLKRYMYFIEVFFQNQCYMSVNIALKICHCLVSLSLSFYEGNIFNVVSQFQVILFAYKSLIWTFWLEFYELKHNTTNLQKWNNFTS